MTYDELIILYPMVDLFLELFKGLAPTIVAVLAIVVNNVLSRKREQETQRISKIRLVNSGKIAVLNNLMEKYMILSKLYWIGGSTALEYLGLVKEEEIKEKLIEVKNHLLHIQHAGLEIHDYYYAVVNQYDFSIPEIEQINDTNKLVGDVMDVSTQYSDVFKCEDFDKRIKLLDEASEKLKSATMYAKNQALHTMSDIATEIKKLTEEV